MSLESAAPPYPGTAAVPPPAPAVPPVPLVIRPQPGWRALDLREVWRYRELLYFLTWRDIKVRYKQTVLGAAWAVIQPLFQMVVLTIFFGWLAGLSQYTEGVPYPVFVFAATLPWTYFANSLGNAGNSLIGSANLITKVYFPRLIVPASAVVGGLVDYAIGFGALALLLLWYGVVPSAWSLVAVPALTLLTTVLALGISLWLSALNVQYRDIRYVIPFLVQLWMYATPVAWPYSRVPEAYRWLVALNPAVGIVQGFRSCLCGQPWDFLALGISLVAAVVTLVTGCYYFRSVERSFADVV